MEGTKDSFIAYGGHKMSGGFSVSHEKIHTLEDDIVAVYERLAGDASGTNGPEKVVIDKRLTIDDVTWDTYKIIEQLAPFGVGNPKPLFLFERVKISGARLFGKERNHLQLTFTTKAGKSIPAISFFAAAEQKTSLTPGMHINLVATIEKSMFRNFPELRLRIVDIIV
jgi:single-stranded-DNA-specific exonuclease